MDPTHIPRNPGEQIEVDWTGDPAHITMRQPHRRDIDFRYKMRHREERMEKGEPACIAGKSGIELAAEILEETMGAEWNMEPQTSFERSVEYWIRWAVAYYQLYSGRQYDGGSD